ncbi:MarR family winged helix-turn-helix transcriptional regulator [Amycolatopsis silviterrae]|uniref:MarR family winged helix-turn-helix transcriptional regulator n=1 Tax=Amycolatopsis silviterrae TaxID=1656914 RepID=A0ABW5HLU6_9PSEU
MIDQRLLAEQLRTSIGGFVRATRSGADALAPPLASTMGLLDRDGDSTIASLAHRRGVRHQSQSRTVKELEELGYVTRRADPLDGRGFMLALTKQGRAALDHDRGMRRDWVAQAIAALLTPKEQERLSALPRLLDRLASYDG